MKESGSDDDDDKWDMQMMPKNALEFIPSTLSTRWRSQSLKIKTTFPSGLPPESYIVFEGDLSGAAEQEQYQMRFSTYWDQKSKR